MFRKYLEKIEREEDVRMNLIELRKPKQLLILTFKIKNTNFVINIIYLRKGTLHEGL